MHSVEELQRRGWCGRRRGARGGSLPSLSLASSPTPPPPGPAPHLRAAPGPGAPRTAQAPQRLCAQRRQQFPHQLGAQHLQGRRESVVRGEWRNLPGTPGHRDTAHLRIGAQCRVVATGKAPASSKELHGVQEGAGRGHPAALQD